jgi:hypothetical protein
MFMYRQFTWQDIAATVGYRYDQNHAFWQSQVPASYLALVAQRTWTLSPYFDSLGGRNYRAAGWGGPNPTATPPVSEDLTREPFLSNWTDLVQTVEICEQIGVHVVLVNFPQAPGFRSTAYMGKYGPTWATWKEISRRLVALQASHPYLHFYDANLDGNHDYVDSQAINSDHLSHAGAVVLTGRLDSMLRTFTLRSVAN